ncbi:MAG: hypothetical protein WD060_08850 [Pirellulales bacterium]
MSHDETIFGAVTLAVHGYRFEQVYQATNNAPSPAYVAKCEQALCRQDACVIKVIRDPAKRTVSNFAQFLLAAGVAPRYSAWQTFLAWKRCTGLGFDELASRTVCG